MDHKAKILFVNPPFYRLLGSKYNANSLGLAYTSSVFRCLGYETAIYNADFAEQDFTALSGIFNNQNRYLRFFENEDHDIWNEIVTKILEYGPDMVGYTCYTANVPTIKLLIKKIQERDSTIAHIVGGPHLRITEKKAEFDALTIFTETELMLENNSIDDYPHPDRENFWGVTEEQKKHIDLSYIMTSRGCPYKCTFCANPGMWGKKVQLRSVDSVMYELKEMKSKYGVQKAYILDDTFTLKADRAKSLMQHMIDERLDMTWMCNTRLDCLDEELCELMKKAGCVEAKVGIETGSKRMLKVIKKGETKEKMEHGISLLNKASVPVTAYFMTGFPQETDKDLKETIDFAKKLDIDRYSLSVFAPYFGSQIYRELEASGNLAHMPYQYFYHQATRPLANKVLSDKVLAEYFDLAKLNKKRG